MTVISARWDLTNVYPSLESKEFQSAIKNYKGLLDKLEKFYKGKISKASAKTSSKELGALLGRSVDQFNSIAELSGTIEAFILSFVSTDSHNKTAMRLLSELEQIQVRQSTLTTQFRAWVGTLGDKLDKAIETDPSAKAHAFTLKETRDQSKYMMSEAEEILAA
ncbi:MAG: hypothetical protein ABIQ77_04720, partial [Anaerolineales bacterium]